MITQLPGPAAADFLWASGVEDTFVPQTRNGQRALDEYELMGHYEHWRTDLALARDLGVRMLRWGVPWYRVEPIPGSFDWRWTDEVLPYMVHELGITPIIDLMHYGCPFWLRREFDSAEYPQAVAAYAAAFAERYHDLVRWYTPFNEPIVNALMCGQRAAWPPYLRGDAGYLRVMMQVVQGVRRTVAAIKAVDPAALMVHVEATGLSRAARADLEVLATEEQRRGYVCYDLLNGRVTPDHPLYTWLLRNRVSPDVLANLVHDPLEFDVIGLNFYPQWSTRQIAVDEQGRLSYRVTDQAGEGFAALIRDYYERYQVPVMVTETSARGSVEVRADWLAASLAAIKTLRSEGVPVIGYTWFPMFTMIDWRYRTGRLPVEQYRLELGLYSLGRTPDAPRWQTTPLVAQFQHYVADAEHSVGSLHIPA